LQYEFNPAAGQQMLFVLLTQLAEIGGLKKPLQNFQLFAESRFFAFGKECAQDSLILLPGFGFDAGGQFRFQFYVDRIFYLPYPRGRC